MERIVQFGPQGQLVGILSGASLPDSAPVLVLPSAGLLPRAGPFRLHVELSRRLAPHGVRTFRFDAPGIGESPRLAGFGSREATLAALDHLASEYGCGSFVVGGLCSAADAGWHAAIEDPRVRALLMIDGISYVGPWFHGARLAHLGGRPVREWPGVAKRLWRRLREGARSAARDMADYREWPDRAQAQQQFAGLLARDVRSLWIYTGGYADRFMHPRQFAWSFGAATADERVAMHYWADCDHTFYGRPDRERLIATVQEWMAGLAKPAGVGP